MSRHRIVRSMNYSDEYDGYDDVYGHSVEDDYSMSPSDAAFMYDRDSRQPAQFSAFLTTEEDILEEDESDNTQAGRKQSFVRPLLSDVDEARLRSCRDEVQSVVGDSVADSTLDETILRCDFDVTRTLDALLESPQKKNTTAQIPSTIDTSLPKQKVAATHEGKDDVRIVSSIEVHNCNEIRESTDSALDSDNLAKKMKQSSKLSSSSSTLAPEVTSQCNNIISTEVESRKTRSNDVSFASPPSSSFSSLKSLMLKHKNSADSRRKCVGIDVSGGKGDDITSSKQVSEKVNSVEVLKCPPESSRPFSVELVGAAVNSSHIEQPQIKKELIPSESPTVVKTRSVCSPGRSSSLSALAKRCRNNSLNLSDRKLPSVIDKAVENVKIVSEVSVRAGSLPLEFEKLSVDHKNNACLTKSIQEHVETSATLTNSDNSPKNGEQTVHQDAIFIDLLTALCSPTDEEQQRNEQVHDSTTDGNAQLPCELQEIKPNIISNLLQVKSEFQMIACSPFGEIICKQFETHCKQFDCTPEVFDSKVEPFAFDVISPDDKLLKFRAKW